MNILKMLFGGQEETPEEKKQSTLEKNFDVLKYDGIRALQMGQMGQAVMCLQHALQLRDDMECRDYLSQALIHAGDLDAALGQLQTMATAAPDNVGILLRMAEVCYMLEDYSGMADAAQKALSLDGENPQALYSAARACLGQGDEVNAVALLTKAISLREQAVDASLLRGNTLLRMGDLRGAEEDANHLMAYAGDHEDVLLLKARVLRAKGLGDEAIDIYNKVIEQNPFCVPAFRERGEARLGLGDKDGAEADMRTVLEIDPAQGAEITGSYSAGGIEEKVRQAYRNNDLLHLFPH